MAHMNSEGKEEASLTFDHMSVVLSAALLCMRLLACARRRQAVAMKGSEGAQAS